MEQRERRRHLREPLCLLCHVQKGALGGGGSQREKLQYQELAEPLAERDSRMVFVGWEACVISPGERAGEIPPDRTEAGCGTGRPVLSFTN